MLIIDAGMESFCQILFDSLIEDKGMSNNRIKLSNYANYLVRQYFNDSTSILPKHCDPVVTTQPNGHDCGVFTILNIQHVVMNVDYLLICQTIGLDLTHWFPPDIGCQARTYLLNNMHAFAQHNI
jgi:Ulp1 family protease